MAVTPFKSSDNFNMAGFNEKITEADNTYVAKTGDSMSGALSMGNNKITDVASPVNDGDVANKGYVDNNLPPKAPYSSSYDGWTKIKTISVNGQGDVSFGTLPTNMNFCMLEINSITGLVYWGNYDKFSARMVIGNSIKSGSRIICPCVWVTNGSYGWYSALTIADDDFDRRQYSSLVVVNNIRGANSNSQGTFTLWYR